MNANQIFPETSVRFNRIKIVSRTAKFLVIGFLIFESWFVFGCIASGFARFSEAAGRTDVGFLFRSIVTILFQLILCIWYWKLSRLFRFYEQGLIFAAETIRCIKVLGSLIVIGGIVISIMRLLPQTPPFVVPAGVNGTIKEIKVTHIYHMEFFSFDFGTGIDFGLLLTGCVIILVAWIMDEGRKIQEEQELTV